METKNYDTVIPSFTVQMAVKGASTILPLSEKNQRDRNRFLESPGDSVSPMKTMKNTISVEHFRFQQIALPRTCLNRNMASISCQRHLQCDRFNGVASLGILLRTSSQVNFCG